MLVGCLGFVLFRLSLLSRPPCAACSCLFPECVFAGLHVETQLLEGWRAPFPIHRAHITHGKLYESMGFGSMLVGSVVPQAEHKPMLASAARLAPGDGHLPEFLFLWAVVP